MAIWSGALQQTWYDTRFLVEMLIQFLSFPVGRRDDLMALLLDLPPEEHEQRLRNAFVLVKALFLQH